MTNAKELILTTRPTGKPICFDLDDLYWEFGFKRMDGQEIMLRQLISSKNEKQLQALTPFEKKENIKNWCHENKISYSFDYLKNQITFQ